MSNYDNNNRFSIWGNDRREKDTHPTHRGQAMIDGYAYWVSAWSRKPDAHPKAPALSGSFKAMTEEERQKHMPEALPVGSNAQQPPMPPPVDNFDAAGDIPFN